MCFFCNCAGSVSNKQTNKQTKRKIEKQAAGLGVVKG